MIKKIFIKYKEIIFYLFFGFLTTLVSILSYIFFANMVFTFKTDLTVQIANVLSWIFAVTFAYITNRKYVFKSNSNGKKLKKEMIAFFSARVFSLLVEILLMFLLFSVLHINDTISKIIVQIVVVVLNYLFSKLLIFKK